MKVIVSCLGALLVVLACTASARAQQPYYAGYAPGLQASAAYGPGLGAYTGYSPAYAPSYGPNPPWPPFNGVRPMLGQRYSNHWYARSPRDYFMLDLR